MGLAGDTRVSLVTGGTDGIGRAVALELARGGDRVFIVGRNRERGAGVVAQLEAIRPGRDHRYIPADLSLMAESAQVAEEVARSSDRLDAVVLCAGILSAIPEWTSEGLERTLALNYLSRYLLARRLMPLLTQAPSGRLVLVSNAGQYGDTLDFDDLQHRKGKPGLKVSGRTQFANDLLAVELAERMSGTRVEVTCVYPGLTRSGVFRNAIGFPWIARTLAPAIQKVVGQTPEAAARTPAYLAQSPQAIGTGGRFYGPKVKENRIPDRSKRVERRQGLWALSEALVRSYLNADQQTLEPAKDVPF